MYHFKLFSPVFSAKNKLTLVKFFNYTLHEHTERSL